MEYFLFCTVWAFLSLATFFLLFPVVILWYDKLIERVTGKSLFAILRATLKGVFHGFY